MLGLPSFLVIGAAKSGTTSLHQYLRQHPQISLPTCKETNFFALDKSDPLSSPYPEVTLSNRIDNLADYLLSFEEKDGATVRGEICPFYLVAPNAPPNIKRHVPHCKLMAVLRNPVDRAYSSFYFYYRHAEPGLDFNEIVYSSLKDPSSTGNLLARGYHEDLSRYFALFLPQQIRVYLFDDLDTSPVKLLNDVFEFIEVKPCSIDTRGKFNRSGNVRSDWVFRRVNASRRLKETVRRILPSRLYRLVRETYEGWLYKKPPPMSSEVRLLLSGYYRSDIEKLQDLIGQDLSRWVTV